MENAYYKKNIVKSGLYVFDFIVLNLTYYLSLYYLTRSIGYHEMMTMVMVVAITFLSFRLYNMYQELEHARYTEVVVKSIIANFVSMLGAGYTLMLRQDYGEKMMLTVFPITLGITTMARILVKRYIVSRYDKSNILLIGNDDDIKEIVKKFFMKYFRTYNISYIAPANLTTQAFENKDEVLINQNIWPETKEKIVAEILRRRLSYRIIPGNYEILVATSRAGQIYDSFTFKKMASKRYLYRITKRTMDIVVGLVGLILSSPFILFAALALKIENPKDPIFYTQERVTRDDRVFLMLKLRSMVVDAEHKSGAVLAGKHDARITRVGAVLRKFRFDELPQFWNVLVGDMSLVGPRPERPEFVEEYNKELLLYDYRHRVRAGLTGLAQISGYYSTTAADKLKHDLYYVENHSIIQDIVILLQTAEVILQPSKSAGLDEYQSLEEVVAKKRYKIVEENHLHKILREERHS